MAKPKSEEELYEPIRDYLQTQFAQFGECELEIIEKKIPDSVRPWLDDPALFYIRVEKKLPDIIGRFKPDSSKKPPYGFYEGLIIVEIKNKKPTIRDIFQAKEYAEVFDANYAYLISSKEMKEEMRRFLPKRYTLLSYAGANRRIYIGKFNLTDLSVSEEDWYPETPFKTFNI